MDRFTRRYLIFVGIMVLGLALYWLASLDWGARDRNRQLAEDGLVAAYPFAFRVISIQQRVAKVTTPRNYEVPVARFLAIVEPHLAGRPPDDPEVMAAQQRLATVQKRVKEILLADPEIDRIDWTLDRDWYAQRGIVIADSPY